MMTVFHRIRIRAAAPMLLLLGSFMVPGFAGEAPEAGGYSGFTVYRTDTVAAADAERVREFVSEKSRMTGRDGGVIASDAATIAALAGSRKALAGDDDLVAIVLHAAGSEDPAHAVVDVTNRVVVVNTTALAHDDREVYLRRLDRQGMRGLYFVLGLRPCPHPLCCLYPYNAQHTLDAIGRSGCPPCQFRAEPLFAEKKVLLNKPAFPVPAPPGRLFECVHGIAASDAPSCSSV